MIDCSDSVFTFPTQNTETTRQKRLTDQRKQFLSLQQQGSLARNDFVPPSTTSPQQGPVSGPQQLSPRLPDRRDPV